MANESRWQVVFRLTHKERKNKRKRKHVAMQRWRDTDTDVERVKGAKFSVQDTPSSSCCDEDITIFSMPLNRND